jgi:hypothetical protein
VRPWHIRKTTYFIVGIHVAEQTLRQPQLSWLWQGGLGLPELLVQVGFFAIHHE